MDLNDFTSRDASGTLHLRHPGTGEPLYDGDTPSEIDVLGSDSPTGVRARQRIEDETRRAAAKDRRKAGAGVSSAEIDRRVVELLVELTVGWRGLTKDGEPFTYNPDNARWLYTNSPQIKAQVSEFADDPGNFYGSTR